MTMAVIHPDVVLPKALDAEKAIVQILVQWPREIAAARSVLPVQDFVGEDNRAAIAAMFALDREGIECSAAAVNAKLAGNPAFRSFNGGDDLAIYMAQVTAPNCPFPSSLSLFINQVKNAALKRAIFERTSDAAHRSLNGEAPDAILADLLFDVDQLNRSRTTSAPILSLAQLQEKFSSMRPQIVGGLIREGETANFVSASKVGKTWLTYNLGISVVTGQPWLGAFDTSPGRVLIVDNELHPETIAHRIPLVAEAMGFRASEVNRDIDVWPLRGNLRSLEQLGRDFDAITPGEYKLIILDAKYRFQLARGDENSNTSESHVYNLIDQYAAQTGAAFVLVHHSSKGSQGEKRVTDVGSGAGAQSRAVDCHLVLREHEDDGVAVLEAAVRSFPPVAPLALRWAFPLWRSDEQADASKLKGRLTQQEQRQGNRDKEAVEKIVKAILVNGAATARQLRELTGLGKDRQQRLLDFLVSEDQLATRKISIRGNECKEYFVPEGVGGEKQPT